VDKRAVCVRCQANTAAETHVPHPCCLHHREREGGEGVGVFHLVARSVKRDSLDTRTRTADETQFKSSECAREPDCSNQARLENITVARSPENHKHRSTRAL